MCKDPVMSEKHRYISLSQWSAIWKERNYSLFLEILLVLYRSAHGITLRTATTPHSEAGLGLSVPGIIDSREEVGYYYDSLLYANLTKVRQKTKVNGEEGVRETVETFWKLSKKLIEKVPGKNGIGQKSRLVAERWPAKQFINVARCFQGETTLKAERLNEPRQKNIAILQRRTPSFLKAFRNFRILRAQELRGIALGEKVLVYYGNN